MTDSEIVAVVRAGDRDVFATRVERYQRALYYFAVGKVVDDTEAPFISTPLHADSHAVH